MPSDRHRSRPSRFLASIALGVVVFVAIGLISSTTTVAPGTVSPAAKGAAPVATAAGDESAKSQDAPVNAIASAAPPPVQPATSPPDADGAAARGAPPVESLTGYRWPIARPRLTQPYGPTPWGSRIVDGERFHDGIDLATFCGDRITAAHDGTVLVAGRRFDDVMGWVGDLGPYYRRLDAKQLWKTLPIVVVIDDGNGYRSVYAHFGKVVVERGQTVRAGSLLGYEGATGHASGCHLHYSLFSPLEQSVFTIDPGVVRRMKVPPAQIARVDPRLVLPWRMPPGELDGAAAAAATQHKLINGAGSAAR